MTGLTEHDLASALKRSVPEPAAGVDRAGLARRRAHQVRSRRRTAAVVGAVVVALAVGLPSILLTGGRGTSPGPAAPTSSAHRSAAGSPTAGCSPQRCDPATVLAAIRTPLRLPALAPGGTCPVSASRTFPGGAGFSGRFSALGTGPLYLAGPVLRSGAVQLAGRGQGWDQTKVIWVIGRDYAGPVLLRGARIDRPGALRFDHYLGASDPPGSGTAALAPHRQVLYVRGGLHAPAANVLDSYPDDVFVHGAGCYAIQVDGEGFSERLVVQLTRR